MSQNKKSYKTIDDYRHDIFTLKNKIKQEEQYLDQIKQKCSEVDIFNQQSYSFQMKIKILENDFITIKDKIYKYSRDEYSSFYLLNFCVYALSRACTVIGFTPEMVFRAVDVENKGKIKQQDLSTFFREVLRMDQLLANPILSQLDIDNKQQIEHNRYIKLLRCFMIDAQLGDQQHNQIRDAIERVCQSLIRMQIEPEQLWNKKLLNIAVTAGGIKQKLKSVDNLDCVAVYLRCDPTKQGAIDTSKVVKMLEDQILVLKRFGGDIKGKLKE